jgi:carbonic anhydrase/acetyltransferase-like protein (isoleucine patch superfamily)
MPLLPYKGVMPRVGKNVFIAENAYVIGDVEIGDYASVWYGAVLRGDFAPIVIGSHTSIQENCVVHTDHGQPSTVGSHVTTGHTAVIHGATVGNHCILGMGAILLNGAVVGTESIVGAGAVLAEGKEFGPRSLILGVPGKLVREVSAQELERIHSNAEVYLGYAREYLEARGEYEEEA